jgi:hypothetical protein
LRCGNQPGSVRRQEAGCKDHCPELLDTITYGKARELVAQKAEHGGDRKSETAKSIDKLSVDFQPNRASQNGVGIVTQRKLDKLAAQRPDLLDRVRAGELTADGACVEAGWKDRTWPCPADPVKAAARLRGATRRPAR